MALTNNGNAPAYPKITFVGPGHIYTIRSITTGDELFFNYTLKDGEKAILDLSGQSKTFISTFAGNLLAQGAIIAGSDLSTFRLLPGDNDISIFVDNASATVTMTWDTRFISFDG